MERGRMRAAIRSGAPVTPEPELAKGGPRTARGKAATRANAIKHGLRSDAPVIPEVEDFDEWDRFRDGIIASYAPEGSHETELARRVALLLWRLRRAGRYETEMVAHSLDAIPADMGRSAAREAAVARYGAAQGIATMETHLMDKIEIAMSARMLPSKENMEKIMRYEAHLHRMYIQTKHELEAIQSHRKGDRVSSLTRIDVSGSPL
jgi:hypothetical protein